MPRFETHRSGQPSQRQLRVGELVRHALAEALTRGSIGDPALDGAIVSISEVRMSPDLRHATALVAPLGMHDTEKVLAALNRNARLLRGRISPAIRQMRVIPDLAFRLDTRFEDDMRIDRILNSPEVARDLGRRDEGDGN
ncbi:30S ribosome-binding factor RbfA [Propylenella binzhouense]|uniref:Ribosome-binding factor A n=1 Tax=Propylenella binzhouense TaxID=2555902 RepID=A0A964WTI2_9HYPH|nr:30S ribosome-binding factor RbfA [Propylenella binzhouense]MYZ48018.1 30S ribosome-binding factor RbfA [Propylenella binzhouense]